MDEYGKTDEYSESGLKKENRLLEEKINDDADRPTKRIQSNLPFQKLENRKKAEICNNQRLLAVVFLISRSSLCRLLIGLRSDDMYDGIFSTDPAYVFFT